MGIEHKGTYFQQTNTDSNLSALDGQADVTVITVGRTKHYYLAIKMIVYGTLTIDSTKEKLNFTSTSDANQMQINGTVQYGNPKTSSYGQKDDVYGLSDGGSFAREGKDCCTDGSITIKNAGHLKLYDTIININSCISHENGGLFTARNSAIFCQNTGGAVRYRCTGGEGVDVDGLTTYGVQFDWLNDQKFIKFENFLPLNKGIPIENALGTDGAERLWYKMPNNLATAGALMNNWNAKKDVIVRNAEAGSAITIVPDSVNSPTAHGGRLYQVFNGKAKLLDGTSIQDVKFFIRDTNNGLRIATTTAGNIDETADKTYYLTTLANGVTPQANVLTSMYYRSDQVSDLNIANEKEIVDLRGKNTLITSSVENSSGVNCYFRGVDFTHLKKFDRFYIQNSTSNNSHFECVTDGTSNEVYVREMGGGSPTDEASNVMNIAIQGVDNFDIECRSYLYHAISFSDFTMNGLEDSVFEVTVNEDKEIVANEATANAYTGISLDYANKVVTLEEVHTLNEIYDYQKAQALKETNIEKSISMVTPNKMNSDWNLKLFNTSLSGSLLFDGGFLQVMTAVDLADLVVDGDLHFIAPKIITIDYTAEEDDRLNGGVSLDGYSQADGMVNCRFTTASDITTGQIIWESGGGGVGIALAIQDGVFKVYAGNNATEYCNTFAVKANTKYHATMLVDLTDTKIHLYITEDTDLAPTEDDLRVSSDFYKTDWCGTNGTGVGSTNGTTRCPFDTAFTGTVDDGKIYFWSGADITTSYNVTSTDDGADVDVTFDKVVVTGDVLNDMSSNTVKINLTGGSTVTTSEAGTGNGQVNLVNSVTLTIKVVDKNNQIIVGAMVWLKDTNNFEIFKEVTNSSGLVETSYNYISDIVVTGRVRRSTQSPFYKTTPISATLTSSGLSLNVLLLLDE